MENERMTVKQILEKTRDTLMSLNIPVSLSAQVGIPVIQSVMNINSCIEAITNAEKQIEENKTGPDNPPEEEVIDGGAG